MSEDKLYIDGISTGEDAERGEAIVCRFGIVVARVYGKTPEDAEKRAERMVDGFNEIDALRADNNRLRALNLALRKRNNRLRKMLAAD